MATPTSTATTQQQSAEPLKPFHSFSANPKVSGSFIRFVKTAYGISAELDSCFVSCAPAVITQLFAACYSEVKTGDKIELELTGIDGRTHLYSLKVNGKEIERKRGFLSASKDDLAGAFGI